METSESDIKRAVRVLYRKKSVFFAVSAAVAGLILIGGYFSPKTYEAKSVIFIERNVLNELIKNITVPSAIEEKVKALSTVMKSRSLLQKVIADLELLPKGKSAAELEGLIKKLQDKTEINVEMNRGSRRDMELFIVSYRDSDPVLASNYVNRLVQRYIEDNVSLKREEAYGASRFLLDQLSSFKVKLDKIENAIIKERRERGASDKTVSLYDRLQLLQKKKDDLLLSYTENHPEVARVESEIQMVRDQMRAAAAPRPENNSLLDLERERETTKKIYEDLLATLKKSEVSTQMEVQDKAGAFRILDPAVVPGRPLSPNMPKMVLLALLGGIAAGAGLVMVLHNTDETVQGADTLKKLGLPVLAVISSIRTESETARIRKRDRMLYTAAALYLTLLIGIATVELLGYSFIDDFMQGTKGEIKTTMKKIWNRS